MSSTVWEVVHIMERACPLTSDRHRFESWLCYLLLVKSDQIKFLSLISLSLKQGQYLLLYINFVRIKWDIHKLKHRQNATYAINTLSTVAINITAINILTVYFHNTMRLRVSRTVSNFNFFCVSQVLDY